MSANASKTTINHNQIRRWADARHAHPARVKGTGRGNDPGMIRLDFPGFSGANKLEEISWDRWFDAFDNNNLALVYQEKTASGKRSNFNKLVGRETVQARERGASHASRHKGEGRSGTGRLSSGRTRSSRTSSGRTSSSRTSSSRTSSSRSGASRASTSRERSGRSATRRAGSSKTRMH
ncbi:MAG TPA: hypothetical protein VFS11_04200 [Gemmatimonadales bacterium]|nr:hypothetical protein [Gemmatimonadales bacterium]